MFFLSVSSGKRRKKTKDQVATVKLAVFLLYCIAGSTNLADARLQCGNLECYASPGVRDFAIHCKEQSPEGTLQTKSSLSSAKTCKNLTPRVRLWNDRLEGGKVWNKTIRGSCRQNRVVRLLDTIAETTRAVDVCVRPSKTRYLVFDMNEGFANQVMSLVNAVYLARRFSFVLVLPSQIASRSTMRLTNPLHHSAKLTPFTALFDLETLTKRLSSIGVQATLRFPGESNLQYVSLDIPRRSSYVEVADSLGALATSQKGKRVIVDVGNLFLKFTPDTCEQQDTLFVITRLVTSSFRKDISRSAARIAERIRRNSETGDFNAIHLRIEEDSKVWTVTDTVKRTWEERVLNASFSPDVPIYVACGDSCEVSSSRFQLLQKSDFRDMLPASLQEQDIAAALDFLVLVNSIKFAGSTFSAFSHLVVTQKEGKDSYDIYGQFSAPFQSSNVGILSYGGCSSRQPCLSRLHEEQLNTFHDLGHAPELLSMRRVLLSNHGISPNFLLDFVVVLELLGDGKRNLAFAVLSAIVPQIRTRHQASMAESRVILDACSFLRDQQGRTEKNLAKMFLHALSYHGIRCDKNLADAIDSSDAGTFTGAHTIAKGGTAVAASAPLELTAAAGATEVDGPLHVLFVTHNLLVQGAPLMMLSWLEYLVGVLRVQVDVLAPQASCDAAQPLQDILISAGVRKVFCGQKLYPKGYDVIYLNTIVSWFDPPDDEPSSSWLEKTIWWVHESARALLFPSYPLTEKMLPLARKRIFVSNATRTVFSDLSHTTRDTVIYNALHSNGRTVVLADEARRFRLREKILHASDEAVVFLLLGSVNKLRHQVEFVNAGISVLSSLGPRDQPACKFAVVGFDGSDDPETESNVRSIVTKSGYADHFILLKKLDHDAAVRMISVADVLVSVGDLESFGMTILEGMTFGLPLIVQNVDGVPEVAYEGTMHVNPRNHTEFSNAISEMLDPAVRALHRKKSAQRSRFFSKHAFSTKHLLGLAEVF